LIINTVFYVFFSKLFKTGGIILLIYSLSIESGKLKRPDRREEPGVFYLKNNYHHFIEHEYAGFYSRFQILYF